MPPADTSLAAACHAFANSESASEKFFSWSFTLFIAALIDCAVFLLVVFIVLLFKFRKSHWQKTVKNIWAERVECAREVTDADARPGLGSGIWRWMLSTLRLEIGPKSVPEERWWTIPTSDGRNGRTALGDCGDLSLFDANFTNSTWTATNSRVATESEPPSASPSPPPPAYNSS